LPSVARLNSPASSGDLPAARPSVNHLRIDLPEGYGWFLIADLTQDLRYVRDLLQSAQLCIPLTPDDACSAFQNLHNISKNPAKSHCCPDGKTAAIMRHRCTMRRMNPLL